MIGTPASALLCCNGRRAGPAAHGLPTAQQYLRAGSLDLIGSFSQHNYFKNGRLRSFTVNVAFPK
jgi:hypothetical protein